MADLEDLVKTTLGELRVMAKAQSVVGDPVEVGDTTVIPLVKTGFGFGGGGAQDKDGGRSGTGAGGGVQPVAVLVVNKDGDVRLERMSGQSGVSSAAHTVVDLLKSVLDRFTKPGEHKES